MWRKTFSPEDGKYSRVKYCVIDTALDIFFISCTKMKTRHDRCFFPSESTENKVGKSEEFFCLHLLVQSYAVFTLQPCAQK